MFGWFSSFLLDIPGILPHAFPDTEILAALTILFNSVALNIARFIGRPGNITVPIPFVNLENEAGF